MTPKRVLLPVVLILVCGAILLAYTNLNTGRPAPSVTPSPPRNPSPTLPVSPGPPPSTPTTHQNPAAIPAVGNPAPDFSLPSVSGQTVSLSDYRGTSVVVLVFYRTGG